MDPLHARYPYFRAAREAVERADVSLPALIAEGAPAVERGRERVERALMEGTTAPAEPREWSVRDELLSYPVARVLVSLVDASGVVEKYAAAEAATAAERFAADFEADEGGLRSADRPGVDRDRFLAEFGLADAVREATGGRAVDRFRVDVTTYLGLVDVGWGAEWRLVTRDLRDGDVGVDREELYRLLREAVRERVARGLPFDVEASAGGAELAASLTAEVDALRDLLSMREGYEVDTVVPALFPPCMKNLLARAQRGADLDPHSQFALTAFLAGIGMDTDEVVRLYRDTGLDEETVRYQTEYLRDAGGSQYPAPSCATMQAYGDCVNRDERCETISHPMTYYGSALADADDEKLRDWRETSA